MENHSSGNWFEAHPRSARWLGRPGCLLFLEGITRLLVGAGLLPYRTYPTTRVPQYWAYVDPVVGVWRYPNTTFRQNEKCLDVTYQSNSAGARDPERELHSDAERRFVVLGDSFIEGYGLAAGDGVTNLRRRGPVSSSSISPPAVASARSRSGWCTRAAHGSTTTRT